MPAQAKARDLTLERPAEPAGPAATSADAEAAARLRQERLAGLRGALAPLREEARRLHDAARDCAAAPVESGLPWARQSLEFAAWQSAALADDACAQSLAVHTQACGLGLRDPAVQELRRLFDRASRVALESAMQAAESALLVFLQSWDAADSQAGSKRAGVHSRADLVALGGDMQRQWREAPLWPRMPVLGARMAVFDACEAIHDVKAGRQTAARDAAERMCQAAADAQHACEGAKGLPGARLRTFRASCKSQRDDLLHTVVRQEYEAAEAALARASQELQPLLERSGEISTMCHVLLASDPLPAARTGEPALQAAPPLKPAAMPEADRGLIETARALEAATRAQREQAFKLPADSPGQAMLEQQAVLKVLQQSEKAAETAAATVTSFHALRAALALEPPDKQPSIVRSHVKAMAARAEALNDLLLAQEDALEHIPDAQVRDLVLRSCVPLRHDLRQVQVVEFSLETLAKLLDVRVSANHVSLRVSQGRSNARVPELNGKAHAAIGKWMQDSMGSIQDLLQRQEDLFEADTWQAARTRLTETIGTLHRRIHCESALIRAKYFLHVLDMVLPAPDSASLGLLKVVESLATQSIQRSSDLAEATKAMQAHAAATPQPSEQHAQIRMNEAIRVQLRTKQKQLLSRQVVLLARKQAQAAAAVSQGQAGQLQDGASSSASGRGGRRGRP
ncbi:MAG TPA: hypothetical protein VFL86_06730 [Burkholderiaceae bacterium]|nr:hypothetical protein [Burkholderiaceae bacterium]